MAAPRFQDNFAVSNVNQNGVALVLHNNHCVCLLPQVTKEAQKTASFAKATGQDMKFLDENFIFLMM